jgi:hypothetical protein
VTRMRLLVVPLLLATCGQSSAMRPASPPCASPPECEAQGGPTCSADRRTVQACEARDGCLQRVTRRTCHPRAICAGLPGSASCQQVSAGSRQACALTDGNVRCWGPGSQGAVSFAGGGRPVQISAGDDHGCALTDDGQVQCWGGNRYGQLGTGQQGPDQPTAVRAAALGDAMTSLSAGVQATCGIARDRSLRCWGWNSFNALGTGTHQNGAVLVPERPPAFGAELLDFHISRAPDSAMSCALAGRTVQCYGRGTGFERKETGPAEGLVSPVQIALGYGHACALEADGRLLCWGWNGQGQVGDGTTRDAARPVVVLDGVASVAAGFTHSCAVTMDRRLRCWGDDSRGAIGDGQSGPGLTVTGPGRLVDVTDVVQVTAGDGFTCALTADASVWCWGRDFGPTPSAQGN